MTRNKRTHSSIIEWQVQSYYLTFLNSHSTHGKVHGTPVVNKMALILLEANLIG